MTRAWLVVLVACGGAPPALPPVAVSASAPLAIDAGPGATVVEQGDAVYVVGGAGATVVRGGAIAGRIAAPGGWTSAASIAAPDGDGRWVVAVDAAGALWRLTLAGDREPIADRFGLGAAKLRAVGGAGATTAFDLGDAVAYTIDGLHLARVPAEPAMAFAVAPGMLARAVAATRAHAAYVEEWDLARGTRVTYPLAASRLAFLDGGGAQPRLVAADGDRVWLERAGGLDRVRAPAVVSALAARGDRLWLTAGGRLFELTGERLIATTERDPRLALLAASRTGDAWLATERGLVRASPGAAHDDPAWQAQVAPVFQRVCAHCHLPGGEADFDLSSAAAWQADRAELVRRVLVTRTMPPAGTELSDADRAALAAWLQH